VTAHLDVDVWLLPPDVALHHLTCKHGDVHPCIALTWWTQTETRGQASSSTVFVWGGSGYVLPYIGGVFVTREHSALLCIQCLAVNTVPCCQHSALLSTQCLAVYTVPCCQYSALLCIQCLAVNTFLVCVSGRSGSAVLASWLPGTRPVLLLTTLNLKPLEFVEGGLG
jgi:hypothetical protein